ncbi:uncharacterized protein JN550_008531 [Neoarthrinium moseri]|uniref:uncharacterized protein n=1 Tax=Neoarthrinium moseri TaxID=1658444 RepID=UPI001FDE85AD|nr:uncharacterized protein JN550_008531 [Neoarthrinium moseri]KAI1864985.1 hypothetical protein JN550_008531 [Neoarthrinium moseri]
MENPGTDNRPRRAGQHSSDASDPVHARTPSETSFLSLSDSSTDTLSVANPVGDPALAVPRPDLSVNSSSQHLLDAAAPIADSRDRPRPPPLSPSIASSATEHLKSPAPWIDPHLSRDFRHVNRDTTADIIDEYLAPRSPKSRATSVSSRLSVEFAPENVGASKAHRPVPLKPTTAFERRQQRKRARDVAQDALSPIESVTAYSGSPTSPTKPPTPVTPAAPATPATPAKLGIAEDHISPGPTDSPGSIQSHNGPSGRGGLRGRGGQRGRGGLRGRGGRQGRGGMRGLDGPRSLEGTGGPQGSSGAGAKEPNDKKKSSQEEKKAEAAPPGPLNDRRRKRLAKGKYGDTIKDFVRIFSYTTKRDRVFIAISAFAAIVTGLTFPAMTIVFGNLVGSITTASFAGHDVKLVLTGIINQSVLYMLYLFAARFVSEYIATLGFNIMSIRVSSTLRLAYLQALMKQRVSMLDTQPPGQLAAIITATANTVQDGVSEKFALLIQSIALMIGAMSNAFYHSWKLTLVTSSGLVLIIICYCITTPFVVRNMKAVEQINIKASGVASEVFGAIRMIAAFGAEARMVKKYEDWVSQSRQRGMRLSKIVAVQKSIVYFSVIGTFALSCWFAARMIVDGEIPNNSILIIVLMCVMMTTNTIGNIAQPLSAASRAAASARILFNGIEAPKPKPGGKKAPEVNAADRLVLWNVNFTYPSRPKQKILDQLKLVIPAGKVTAIVGPSGSGKSTVVNLIERWYELDGAANKNKLVQYFRNGSVKCGGVPLHEIDLKWWRSQIGLVQQEPFLFNDTIFTNVAYGLIGTEWENAEEDKKRELVAQACKEAFADEFIARLPDGYDTAVGESGGKLSGGQRQRLAIARAIIKKPKILILDEATSAIDVRAEKVVQAALDKVSKGRTTIMIAHRLSTVKKADHIIVMAKGKVSQWGKHEQLMAKKDGPYYLLTQAQQLSLGDEKEPSEDSSDITESEVRTMDLMEKDEETKKKRVSMGTSSDGDEESEPKSKGLIKSFGPLLLEQKQHWPWYLTMFSGAVVAGTSSPVQAYLFAALLSSFNVGGQLLLMLTNFWSLMFVILAGCVGVGYFALGFASTRVAFIITTSFQREYFNNIIAQPISWFDKEDSNQGSLTSRLAMDAQALQQLLGINMAFVIIAILSVTGCLAVAFYFGWKLTAVALSCAMPLAIGAGFFRSRIEKKFHKMNNKVFAESAKFATESMGAIRTVTALTLEDSICRRYENLLDDHVSKAFKKARLATIIFAASDAIPLLCMAFILWYGGGLLVSGEYWSFQYLVVYIAVIQGAMGVGQWLSFVPNMAQATVAANRLEELRKREFDAEHGIKIDDEILELDDKNDIMGPKIELQDVWFKYPTRDVPVLCGLDMTIEKGQFAAIVGPSGCGKTSVISLLERYYNVKSGSVLYNGFNIEDINLRDYRKTISLVAQEAFMFQGSIRENILLGVDEDAVSEEDLHQACRDAEIHDFIISLPDGYNTKVGFKGILLSGGQKQRMAIARALIRNPRLLLLDEATSALDSETEKLVQGVLERTKKSRTMIVVAHRLSTIQNADIIYVLGDGSVVESGTHAQLLQKRGVYWSMCQAQALDR